MILDDHDPSELDEDRELNPGDDDESEEVGEWLDGLRAAGLPVRAPTPFTATVRVQPPDPVRALVAEALAPSTLASYAADWQHFGGWCHAHGIDPNDADAHLVARWVAYLVDLGLAVATLHRRLAAITYAFGLLDRPSPAATPLVRKTLGGARRRLGTGQRRALPIGLDDLRRIVTAVPIILGQTYTHPMVQRDRTLLLTGWAGALRRSELVNLDVADLSFEGDPDTGTSGGMLLGIRRSKTDQTRTGAAVAVPWSTHFHSCPVRAAMRLARARRVGPLFVTVDRHGNEGRRLEAASVNVIVKRYVETVLETDPSDYSAHSLRAGFVTEARHRRVPDTVIARHTRHKDLRMLSVYDRPTDLFNDAALAGEWW